ncbi:MAG TPA: asparaginase [Mycobacteriales bacterium]|nr:asparaginase [Mycobacteriales bacterium]
MTVVVAEVVRSGFVESRHHGSAVALSPAGEVLLSVGDVATPLFPRSSNKPMQAAGLLRLGIVEKYGLDARHVALATASHSGEQVHVDVVRDLLAKADVAESDLACPADLPLDVAAARAVLARGGGPSRVQHNCSGKHAAFLAACAAQGWPLDGYRDETHPLQVHLRGVVAELAGEEVATTGVDGCGAPIFALSLTALARAFGRIATATEGTPEHAVAQAIRTHPDLLGGTGRDVTRLVRAVPGLIAKDGAEGVYAAALPDGTAVALKVEDGASRARPPVMVAALRALGVTGDDAELAALAAPEVLGGGAPVGEVRAVAGLFG